MATTSLRELLEEALFWPRKGEGRRMAVEVAAIDIVVEVCVRVVGKVREEERNGVGEYYEKMGKMSGEEWKTQKFCGVNTQFC